MIETIMEKIPLIPLYVMFAVWIGTLLIMAWASFVALRYGLQRLGWALMASAFGALAMVLFYLLILAGYAEADLSLTVRLSRILITFNGLTYFNAGAAAIAEFRPV